MRGGVEVKKIEDCKEGDLIDGETKLSTSGLALYTFGSAHRPCSETIKYGGPVPGCCTSPK